MNLIERTYVEILYPKSRKEYLETNINKIKEILKEQKIKMYMEDIIKIRTRQNTTDPLSIVRCKDFLHLICRGVDIEKAELIFKGVDYEIVNINLNKKEIFIKRRNRIIGPDGKTLEAIEMLTGSYLCVFGKTVSIIGGKINQAKEIVKDIMKNIHPVYKLKEQMIKNECPHENWKDYVPKIKKTLRRKRNKKVFKKNKKSKLFPDPPKKRKDDFLIENGEYFKDN